MLAIYLLALCCYEGGSVVIDIPEDFGILCPYSDICNRSATADLNTVGKRPCCKECSCDKSCGMRLNCCFEEYDTYKFVERGLVACITPFEGEAGLINKHSSFYMIQTCYDNEKDLNKPCRTRDELGYSLIAPVSSTDTGYIYVNDECAKCNGLVATKAWTAFFVNAFSPRPSLFHLNLRDSLMENTSTLLFKPPAGESWHKMQCFKNYDSDLSPSCKNSELNDLCEYLNAPYETTHNQRVYKNIYCMMCQGVNQYVDFECESYSNMRGPFAGSFTMLLDWEAITYLKQRNNRENSPSVTGDACAEDLETTSQDECLHVHCPEGQTDTPKGCNHLGLWWYTYFFLMQIKLVPLGNERPSVSSLLQLGSTERNNPFSWIQPQCKKLVLTAMTIYYEILGNTTEKDQLESFVVVFGRMTFDSNGFDPSVVIPLMKQCIDNTWRLRINKTTYMFSASFDEYTNYVQDGQQLQSKYSVDDDSFILQNKPAPAVFERISSNLDFTTINNGGILLRKTFFCKQVQLSIDKVEVDYGRIKIPSKNITIGSNKYTFNYYPDQQGRVDKNKLSFSVCLDDYLPNNTSHGMCKRHSDFMILCTIISWQFIISIFIN